MQACLCITCITVNKTRVEYSDPKNTMQNPTKSNYTHLPPSLPLNYQSVVQDRNSVRLPRISCACAVQPQVSYTAAPYLSAHTFITTTWHTHHVPPHTIKLASRGCTPTSSSFSPYSVLSAPSVLGRCMCCRVIAVIKRLDASR